MDNIAPRITGKALYVIDHYLKFFQHFVKDDRRFGDQAASQTRIEKESLHAEEHRLKRVGIEDRARVESLQHQELRF